MNNEAWQNISTGYNTDVFIAAQILSQFPPWLRPLVHWFVPHCIKVRRLTSQARSIVEHEVERMKSQIKSDERVRNSLDWFTDASKGRKFDYTGTLLNLSLVSMLTTSNTISFTMFDLLEHPQYIDELREEITTVMKEEGSWSKKALQKLLLMDACLKESLRLHPMSASKYSHPPIPILRL